MQARVSTPTATASVFRNVKDLSSPPKPTAAPMDAAEDDEREDENCANGVTCYDPPFRLPEQVRCHCMHIYAERLANGGSGAYHCTCRAASMDGFYFDYARNVYVPIPRPEPDLIVPHLYLGDLKNAMSPLQLQHFLITHILSVMPVTETRHLRACLPPQLLDAHRAVSANDSIDENLGCHFDAINTYIDSVIGEETGEPGKDTATGNNMLVHCHWGMSRSASVVIAYVMHRYCLTFCEAGWLVKKRRPITFPNDAFLRQLRDFESYRLVTFCIRYNTRFGQNLYIVGGHTRALGGWWRWTSRNMMTWHTGGVWRITLPVLRTQFAYKYAVVEELPQGANTGDLMPDERVIDDEIVVRPESARWEGAEESWYGADPSQVQRRRRRVRVRWETCANRWFGGDRVYVSDWWNATPAPGAVSLSGGGGPRCHSAAE
eukprot:TRINITY_DN308_c0_g1_i16.p1 TRINITY_DN308_c0_g1~~TRINITY_DN308_c0_g1_i16.p1  ORF type:complete len:433 (-),score=83.37 TRINITY_DN308_c0_g1_i16:1166-2464(-)